MLWRVVHDKLAPLLLFFTLPAIPLHAAQPLAGSSLVVEGLGRGTAALDGQWQFRLGDDPAWLVANIRRYELGAYPRRPAMGRPGALRLHGLCLVSPARRIRGRSWIAIRGRALHATRSVCVRSVLERPPRRSLRKAANESSFSLSVFAGIRTRTAATGSAGNSDLQGPFGFSLPRQ